VKLHQNEGTVDRVIRVVLGLALTGFALAAGLAAPLVYLVWAVAAIALVTGAVGICPLYALLGLGSRTGNR